MKAIIFDMDGLMIDTERVYFEIQRKMARDFGRELKDETLWKMMGRKPMESMSIFAEVLDIDKSPQELLNIRDGLFEERIKNDLVPMPGLFEILDEFRGRMKLAIATGSPNRLVKMITSKLNIGSYFDVLQASDEIVNGKPDPEIYLKTVEKLGFSPGECIVLEDSSNGALAGKRAGCYTIAIPSEYTCKQDFSFTDYTARDLNDAREHIIRLER
ncbi:MAG: HAD family hydrolase [Bacillota bacterium]